jgi:hypothetical protein
LAFDLWSCTKALPAGVAMVLLMGFASLQPMATPAGWQQAKLSLSSLSPLQVRMLRKRADEHALAEALLNKCGFPPQVERRMLSVAKDCVEAAALGDLAAYYRKRVAEFGINPKFICSSIRSQALLKIMRARIDRDIEAVRTKCSACLLC